VPFGPFIVDFCCLEARLIVEIDGPIHEQQQEYDNARDLLLRERGSCVLRFGNEKIAMDLSNVLSLIIATAQKQSQFHRS
jgi:very-short-patch-repair endonuclease